MKTKKQKIFLFLKLLLIVLIVTSCVLYAFRDTILQKAVTKLERKFDTDYNCVFKAEKINFNGFSGIEIKNLTILPKAHDTLLSVKKIKSEVSLAQLLIGDIQLKNLEIENGFIQLVKNEKGRNFDAFLKHNDDEKNTSEKRNYAKRAYKLLSKALNLVPTNMHLSQLSFKFNDMGRIVNLHTNSLILENKTLKTVINVRTNTFEQNWTINGFADPRNKKADLKFFNNDTSKIKVPYIDERFNIVSSFRKIHVNLKKLEMDSGELHIDGFTSIEDFTINNKRIANKDVIIKKAVFDYRFLLGSNSIAIDSSSTIQLNKIKIHPFVEYNTEKDTTYKLNVNIPNIKANDFITSLPEGLFSHFKGMEAKGNFDYKLVFKFNKNNHNDLVFTSKLNKKELQILKYGEANLAKINGEFTYRAIENGIAQRPINVGNSNPNYIPLNEISPYLQKCVLTSEDPSFFRHNGFINEAFKQSILKNIKTRKFARGASTISMQLVKNVFLTREKTLSRKLEEILLVYILENNRIVSKHRMLEVYFNIIEWGPNVYGIGEASRFYFQKSPSELNLKECLFLANIVPKPKKFMWQFDQNGGLKSFVKKQHLFIRNLMFRRGLINSEDTIGQNSPLNILGRANTYIKIKKQQDSIAIDSIFIENSNEMDSFE